jgi:CHAT domain-containing protein
MVDAFYQHLLSGKMLYSEGKYAHCIKPYEEALKIALSNPALSEKLPEIYVALGSSYDYTGDYEKARTNFEYALAISKQIGYKSGECSCQLNLSMVYRNLNNYPESLACLDKAKGIALEIGNKQRLAETYLQYGFVHDDLGNYPKAEKFFLSAFDTILPYIINCPIRFLALLHKNLAATYFALTKYEDSECYLKVAEKLDIISKNEDALAITRMNLGTISHIRNKNVDAIEYYQKSLSVFQNLGNKREAGHALLNMGIAYSELDDKKAQKCFADALKLGKEVNDLNLLMQLHLQFGRLYYSTNKQLSFEHLEKSIKFHELQRSYIINYNMSIFFNLRLRYDAFEFIVPLCVELDKKQEAFEYTEKSKSNAFIELLKTTRIEPKGISDKLGSLLEKETTLLEKMINYQRPNINYDSLPHLETNTITSELEKIYDEIEKIDPQYVHLRRGKLIKPQALQEIAKINDTIFVEYYIASKDSVIIFVISSDVFEAKKINLPNPLEAYFISFHKKVVHIEEHNSKVMWTELSHYLLEPIKDYLIDGKVVCFIPSGFLYYIPLHALKINDKLLIEKNAVMYSTSASVIPFYHSKGSSKYETCSAFAISSQEYSFEQEAKEIAALFDSEVITNSHKSNLPIYLKKDILHFATHGRFGYGDPMRSNIALNEQEILDVREIFELNLNAELVTLSACETGIQGIGGGDELIGLTNAFVYAGAASLLVSLWVVEDESTRELMNYFYNSLKNGMNKAVSLQRAILHIMKKHSNPHYWAPFILIGKLDIN